MPCVYKYIELEYKEETHDQGFHTVLCVIKHHACQLHQEEICRDAYKQSALHVEVSDQGYLDSRR